MAISESQFKLLYQLIDGQPHTQRELSDRTQMALGKVNRLVQEMKEQGLLDDTNRVTPRGIDTMQPYKVHNAIIMAAGMSTRFAPLSYEKPKALLEVKGEILIEREIRQLQAAGITDITVVVGYMKEKMYYLADKFHVQIVVNEDYYRYNNTSTLMQVLDRLDNTYICSSDNYFTENVFEPYVYRSYYSAVYSVGPTDEYCLSIRQDGRIRSVSEGGTDAWYMLGHVYWDRDFSAKFRKILMESYDDPVTRAQLWENLYMRHIKELDLYIRKYPDTVIKEFDSLDELRTFDAHYVVNTDSQIFRNIDSVLHCEDKDISNIVPIKTGLTNVSFRFRVGEETFVYRHPGPGTEKYINRRSEAASMEIARKLGLDDTFIYIDPEKGWKISHFVEHARLLNYNNKAEVLQALKMVRKLHTLGGSTEYRFDLWKQIDGFYESLARSGRQNFEGADQIREDLARIRALADSDKVPACLCHGDCYNPNFLLDDDNKMYLIDWEYSGMADPAGDLGTFIACSPYDMKQADEVITAYLGYRPGLPEFRHYVAYVAILSYYWFVWSLYQDSVGKPVGEWQYLWYKSVKAYSARTLRLYQGMDDRETAPRDTDIQET